jgi:hypothetical protein
MHLFSVSYDLLKPGKDYQSLYNRLHAFGAVRALYSQWMLSGNYTAVQLRDDLKNYIDANDRLLVIDVTTGQMAWTTLEADIKTAFSLT